MQNSLTTARATEGMSPGQKAANKALSMVGQVGWYRQCLGFVNSAWGHSIPWMGAATAYLSWLACPINLKHSFAEEPTIGAALYYATGDPAGHVAIYVGNGKIVSNDVIENGKLSLVPMSAMTDGPWRLRPLGWANPDKSAVSASLSLSDTAAFLPGGSTIGAIADSADQLTKVYRWVTDWDNWRRVFTALLGLVLITLALTRITGI